MEKKRIFSFSFLFFGGVGGGWDSPLEQIQRVGREKKSGWKRLRQNMNFHHNLIKLIQTATLLSASDE